MTKLMYQTKQILRSHFASHSRFVNVFSVCKLSLQSFDIMPPKYFLSIIIIIITTLWVVKNWDQKSHYRKPR